MDVVERAKAVIACGPREAQFKQLKLGMERWRLPGELLDKFIDRPVKAALQQLARQSIVTVDGLPFAKIMTSDLSDLE